MTFGSRLKQLRLKKDWTQSQLGEKINVTKASISGYENDTRSPDKDTLVKLANLFGVSTDFLLGNDKFDIPPQVSAKQLTVAAHIDDDVSEEGMKEIMNFIDFIKQRDHMDEK